MKERGCDCSPFLFLIYLRILAVPEIYLVQSPFVSGFLGRPIREKNNALFTIIVLVYEEVCSRPALLFLLYDHDFCATPGVVKGKDRTLPCDNGINQLG